MSSPRIVVTGAGIISPIGAGMGLVSKWMFSACVASAQWAGTQMGFSVGGVIDPEMHSSDSAWAQFNQWVGIMLFLAVGGHYTLIQALADSYQFNFDNIFVRLPSVSTVEINEAGS